MLALAVLLSLPAVGIIVYSGIKVRNELYHTAEVETQKLADNLAASQENIITEAQLLASLLADLPDVQNRNYEKVRAILTTIQKRNPQYQSILIADEAGLIWASSISGMERLSVAERRYFTNARATMQFSSGEYAVHKVIHTPTISMAQPLLSNKGAFAGAIILSYNLEVMRSILHRSQLPPDTNYRLVDHNGVIISNGSDAGIKVGEALPAEQFRQIQAGGDRLTASFTRSDQDQRIFTSRKLWLKGESDPYMYIRATISARKARAAANRQLLINVSLFLPFVATSFLLAFFIGKRSISDRVAVLRSASQQIADGNLAARVAQRVEGGELGELGRAFDEMAVKLADDISRRELADEYLHDAMQRLQLATASGRLGVWDWTLEGNVMLWDDRMLELYGISRDSFTSSVDAWVSGLHPDDKERAVAECQSALAGEKEFNTTFRVIHPDGKVLHIKADGIVARDSKGKAIRMIGINRDITDEKRMKDALEHRLIALTSPLASTADINFDDLFNLDEIQQIQDAFALATGVASIITDINGKPITKPSNFCHLCEHIIRKTEKGLANCYKSDAALGRMNPAGPIIQPCLSGGLWDGGASIQIGDTHIANWLIGQVLDESCDMDRMMAYAREIGADEEAYRTALGSVTRMSLEQFAKVCHALYKIADQLSRQALQNVQQAKHITERVRAEEALKREQLLTNAIFDSVPGLLYLYDDQGKLVRWNKKHETLTGYTAKELAGMQLLDWYRGSDEDITVISRGVEQCLAEGYAEAKGSLQIKDGTRIRFHFTAVRLEIDGKTYFAGIGIDITEREKLQSELLKMQKLESLGVLAGGIAHDFNNLLTGIMGNISFARMVIDDSHEAFKPLEKAEKASMRAAGLAKKLLIFAKGGDPVKKPVLVQDILHSALALFLSGTAVKGSIEIPRPLPVVEGDESQLSQAFHNIIINAVQAMPGGGKLIVRGDTVALPVDNSVGLAAGTYAQITFTDEGCGITEADQKKVFDPYFSTKAAGSGLGLASTHAIITKHGGQITVESVVGVGTTFAIYLPATSSATIGDQRGEEAQGNKPASSILVMDDDDLVRDFAAMTLGRLGYRVVTCINGDEAIALYRRAKEAGSPFSLVIMDLTIPGGMGGVEAARRILAFDATARLIVSSGYSEDPVMANCTDYGFCAAMEKPYKAATIARILAESGNSEPGS